MARNRRVVITNRKRIYQGATLDGTEYEGEPLYPGEEYSLPSDAAAMLVEGNAAQYASEMEKEDMAQYAIKEKDDEKED